MFKRCLDSYSVARVLWMDVSKRTSHQCRFDHFLRDEMKKVVVAIIYRGVCVWMTADRAVNSLVRLEAMWRSTGDFYCDSAGAK